MYVRHCAQTAPRILGNVSAESFRTRDGRDAVTSFFFVTAHHPSRGCRRVPVALRVMRPHLPVNRYNARITPGRKRDNRRVTAIPPHTSVALISRRFPRTRLSPSRIAPRAAPATIARRQMRHCRCPIAAVPPQSACRLSQMLRLPAMPGKERCHQPFRPEACHFPRRVPFYLNGTLRHPLARFGHLRSITGRCIPRHIPSRQSYYRIICNASIIYDYPPNVALRAHVPGYASTPSLRRPETCYLEHAKGAGIHYGGPLCQDTGMSLSYRRDAVRSAIDSTQRRIPSRLSLIL